MNIDSVVEVYDLLRNFIDINDRGEAADAIITLLIDNNHEADEIKQLFRGYGEFTKALKYYHDQHDNDEADEDEDYDEYTKDDDW